MNNLTQRRSAPRLGRLLGAVALLVTLPLAACDHSGHGADPTASPTESATEAALDPAGKWSSPEAGNPFLEFSEDGGLNGTDGCNTFQSTWEIDGDTVLITPFTTTQKACAGVDTWLSGAASATIEGEIMKVMDAQGSVIGGLEKE